MIKKIIFSLAIVVGLFLQNCKTETVDPIPPVTAPSVNLPSVSGVDGILLAMKTSTKNGGTETVVGTGYAMFFSGQNQNTKVDAGNLTLNTKSCAKSDDKIYFYSPSTTEPLGIVFGTQIFWQGTGNTTTGMPAISDNDGGGFPNMPSLPETINFDKDQDKTINWVSSNGGDSVMLVLKGPSASFKRTVDNSISLINIPKEEIVKLGLGVGTLHVVNFTKTNKTIGSKTFAFIKQSIAVSNKVNFE